MFDKFFDSIFGFMLVWDPLWAIAVLSFIISLVIVLIYKWMTDQKEMKQLKDDLSAYQKKMKGSKDNPEKLMKMQKEAMSLNMKYMGKSMKPTLITFIPILLIFGWMSAHFAYEPLTPGEQFTLHTTMEKGIDGNVSIIVPEGLEIIGESNKEISEGGVRFSLKGEQGEYYATLKHGEETIDKEILITTKRSYSTVLENYKSEVFKSITLGNQQLKVIWKLSWIWIYILFAIIFSMGLRKALKIY